MCMLIEANAKPIKAIADIEVCKVVHMAIDFCSSIYQNFYYSTNKLYQTEMKESIFGTVFDDIDRDAYDIGIDTKFITCGFHSATTRERLKSHATFSHHRIVKCIIPKGSMYYVNLTGCVVSNQIIITNKLV
jgi:hypothetical protein